jgi:protein TonB
VLALAVLGLLAAAPAPPAPAPADTALRVPGTALRFGLADSLVVARGFAPDGAGGATGRCRFFGIDSEARLGFTDGRLARAEFTVTEPSPRQRDYVRDQLAAMGYRRRCAPPAAKDCEWTGRTRVRLGVSAERLQAVVTPPEPPAAGAAPADGVGPVPVLPETLGVSAPGSPSPRPEAAVREAPPCPAPPAARATGTSGRVRVIALVDVDGRVLEAVVLRGIPGLDAAALDCVRRWRFEPRTFQGAPCRFRVEAPVAVTFD